jgi:hypothetical protein
MCNRDHETQHIIALQGDMFRLARRDYALSYKRLSLLSGIPDSTIESWAKGVAMPLHGFIALAPHIPDDLLSMVVEPAGKFVGTFEPSGNDLHDLSTDCADYQAAMARATHPNSPGGVAVVPSERGGLRDISRRMAPKARAVAA